MRLLFLSNGHGEDVIGSRLALQLAKLLPQADLRAFPLVGSGHAWRDAGLPVLGEARDLPAGGLTFHSLNNFVSDLAAGLTGVTWRQFLDLRRQEADAALVIGDIWALALSMLLQVPKERRFALQTLVSVRQPGRLSPARLFMERITAPERLLQRSRTARVWLRDAETAEWLRQRAVPQAAYAGSFLTDRADPPVGTGVLLLPGSRAWAERSLALLLQTAALVPEESFAVAWARPELPKELPQGWVLTGDLLTDGKVTVRFRRGEFEALLAESRAALGTAGTAVEQVAAAGLPVLTFELPGLHTRAFLVNQQRVLNGALHLAASGQPNVLARDLRRMLADRTASEAAREAGLRIAGKPGGLARIAAEIAAELSGS